MLPHKHVAISTVVGAAGWWVTGDWRSGLAALGTGVLPDLDHGVDYLYYYWRRQHRLFLPLHGYEYALLGAVVAWRNSSAVWWVAVLSYLIHLCADQLENRTHLLGYSLLFRAWHRFRLEGISTMPEAAARGRMDDLHMLHRLLVRLKKAW
ncbi:MAG: hypothetical protein R2932_57715 [Caldilineaceae bacterium]